MYGIARPKDMRKDKVAPRSAAPTADAQPRKRNRRTAVKRVRPVSVPQSKVFANGAEEYTEILNHYSLHCCILTPRVTDEKPKQRSALNQLMEAAVAVEMLAAARAAKLNSIGKNNTSSDNIIRPPTSIHALAPPRPSIPEMAPPAEMDPHNHHQHEDDDMKLVHAATASESETDVPPSRSLRTRSSSATAITNAPITPTKLASESVDTKFTIPLVDTDTHRVTYMVPLDMLDEYTFWAFDMLEKLGVQLPVVV
ncbi:hypothetical protein BCR33DRAFT_712928 [Rhizoclosmatium globosum]|uniref:Uncharacterized protein n=1 Tax=Rhizoclosmatium globosum TaxID=329046 RepID=A0A1Y2CVZ8_9FUNG|nr:hypothetical protein BCR33DRAFT_712928 [Rhizoclosmatium globosum]|eukprot:ORY50974.1 hypothetical protein BCR33DRAFT_712928 [Rhizoclosmatium globosum]